jgi:adenylate kinase family enzyme
LRILIFGASGAGTTTLGKHLAHQTGYVHLDADDYYWLATDPPYQQKVSKELRQSNLRKEFLRNEHVIITGSLVSWGEQWRSAFDLAIFIYLDPDIRISRLQSRERARYGDQLDHDPKIQQTHTDFIAWARQYDEPDFDGRSLVVHEEWLSKINCPILRLDGAAALNQKVEAALSAIKSIN